MYTAEHNWFLVSQSNEKLHRTFIFYKMGCKYCNWFLRLETNWNKKCSVKTLFQVAFVLLLCRCQSSCQVISKIFCSVFFLIDLEYYVFSADCFPDKSKVAYLHKTSTKTFVESHRALHYSLLLSTLARDNAITNTDVCCWRTTKSTQKSGQQPAGSKTLSTKKTVLSYNIVLHSPSNALRQINFSKHRSYNLFGVLVVSPFF